MGRASPARSTPASRRELDDLTLRRAQQGERAALDELVVPPPPPQLPEALDRAAISAGVASVKAKLATCATTAKGLVKVHVRVDPKGLVTNVEVIATPDEKLGGCVAAVMARAVFPKTKAGGSFSYPFVF